MKHYSRIILMGMKHTGKSTLGRLLAKKLSCLFYDTDEVIVQLSGKTARDLYDTGGSRLMMEWETSAFRYLSGLGSGDSSVIATGGGLADNPEALRIGKKTGLCVYLDTPAEILFERISESANRDGRLPSFLQGPDPHALFLELFERRTGIYAANCDVHIQAGNKTPQEIEQEITDYLSYGKSTNFFSRR